MKNIIKRVIILFAIVGFFIFAIFFGYNAYNNSNGSLLVMESTGFTLTVNGTDFYVDLNTNDVWFDPQWLTTEYDAVISASEFHGLDVTVGGIELKSEQTIYVPVNEINKDVSIPVDVNIKSTNETKTYNIRTLHIAMPELDIISNGAEDGYYYTSVDYCLYKLDKLGNIVYYRDSRTGLNFDFKRTEIDGKVYYSYLMQSNPSETPNIASKGFFNNCKAVVMNEKYEVIDEVQTLIPNENVPENSALDNHEFIILGENHYIILGYVGKRVYNIPNDVPHSEFGCRVVANVIQEIKNNEVVWQWDSTDYSELYKLSVEGNDYYNSYCEWSDYIHCNSIQIDTKDNSIIFSFRNLDSIVKISRETGEIIWILGGNGDQFGLTDIQKFSRQYFARINDNGTITLFDNAVNGIYCEYPLEYEGNASGVSRVLEIEIDESQKIINSYKSYSVDKQSSPFMGSAVRTSYDNDVFLIGWGERQTTNSLFAEIDFSNNKVLYEVLYTGSEFNTYRVYKFDK